MTARAGEQPRRAWIEVVAQEPRCGSRARFVDASLLPRQGRVDGVLAVRPPPQRDERGPDPSGQRVGIASSVPGATKSGSAMTPRLAS